MVTNIKAIPITGYTYQPFLYIVIQNLKINHNKTIHLAIQNNHQISQEKTILQHL